MTLPRLLYLGTALMALLLSAPLLAADKAILVLDASGSMWGQIGGTHKIAIAREVISGVLKDWPADQELGLVAYGHRRKGDCNDIQTLIPTAKLDSNNFSRVIASLNPKGKTPLSAAVRIAAEQLRYTEDKATVILVSDGKETCNTDPCAVAAELEKNGIDFTTHVIGFDVSDQQGIGQLKCMAENTGGEFFTAKDASGLKDAFVKAVEKVVEAPKIDPKAPVNLRLTSVLKAGGEPFGGTWFKVFREDQDAFGKAKRVQLESKGYNQQVTFNMAPGNYIAQASNGDASAEVPITVEPGKPLDQEIALNAGKVHLFSVLQAGGERIGGSWFKVFRADQDAFGKAKRVQVASKGYNKEVNFVIPQGDFIAQAVLGDASVEHPLSVTAGELTTQELDLQAGALRLYTSLLQGGELVGGSWFKVFREDRDQFGKGKRVQVASKGYGKEASFTLPQGDFIAQAVLGSAAVEVPVRVTAAQKTDQEINLNSGKLRLFAVMAPGGEKVGGTWFKLLREDQDEFGKPKRSQVASKGYNAQVEFIAPAGDYIAQAAVGDSVAETPVSVAAGKGTEQAIDLNAGQVKMTLVNENGGRPLGGTWFKVFRADQDQTGSIKRVQVASKGYNAEVVFTIPAGDYIASASSKQASGEIAFSVGAGQAAVVEVVAGKSGR